MASHLLPIWGLCLMANALSASPAVLSHFPASPEPRKCEEVTLSKAWKVLVTRPPRGLSACAHWEAACWVSTCQELVGCFPWGLQVSAFLFGRSSLWTPELWPPTGETF